MSDEADPVFQNRAHHAGAGAQAVPVCVDCCDDTLVFGLQDRYHPFSIGLMTILECLRVAEAEGQVPKLPDAWWNSVRNRYRALED